MLRPKQLVPFFKATHRSWLVAGPTCGTRPGDGSCHPHGLSNPDEQEGENVRRSTASTPSLVQAQGAQGAVPSSTKPSASKSSTDKQLPSYHTPAISGIFLKETLMQGTVPGSVGLEQHGQVLARVAGSAVPGSFVPSTQPVSSPKVGFAALGGLSTVETVFSTAGNRASSYQLSHQPSSSSSNAYPANLSDTATKEAPAASTGREALSTTSGKVGVPIPSGGVDFHQRSTNRATARSVGGNSRSEWQARSAQPKPSSFHAPPARPWTQPNVTLGQPTSSLLPRQLSVVGTTDLSREDSSSNGWGSKELHNVGPPRVGQNVRLQTGGRRHSHKAASESRAACGEVVDHVCNILRQLNWQPDTLVALSHVNRTLSAFHINEILKHQKETGLALKFFDWAKGQAGYKHDVCTYTTMIGILGRARDFEACSRLLEEMRREGCEPSVVTYNRLIHSYGRANYLGEAMRIFHQMREVGCSPDRVTYCTLVDLHSKAGFHDTAMDMYRQMQQAGFQPDTFTYSVIIHCLGKAGKVNAAYKLFGEMMERGCTPSLVTYNIIIRLQAKAGNHVMAIKLYNDMQDAGFHPDTVTYTIMMEVLGQAGHIDEAENVFTEMEQAGWTPDPPIYGSMVDMWGKAGNADKAWEWYKKMLDSGLTPNVQTSNSLLGTSLRMHQFDSARDVLESMNSWGLIPTLQTHTILLDSCTVSAHSHQVVSLMASTNHPIYGFVNMLLSMEVSPQEMKFRVQRFFESLHGEKHDCKRGFTDALIEFLHKLGHKAEAGLVWEVAREHNLYPLAVRQKSRNYYSIDLHVMSMGTALTALSRTLSGFRETMLYTGRAPDRIDIITGWGKHSRVTGSSLVRHAVQNMLTALGSPFYLDNANLGCFVSSGEPLSEWLHQPHIEHMLLL